MISSELIIRGMFHTTLPVRYTASVLAIVDSHNAGTTVQLRRSKDAVPQQMMSGAVSHSSQLLIGYNRMLYGNTC